MTAPEISHSTIKKIIDCISLNRITGWSFIGEYTIFSSSHHIASYMHKNYPSEFPDFVPPIQRHLVFVQQSLGSLETVFERLQWQKELHQKDKMDSGMFYRFCKEDIRIFYVNYRSIFDHIAGIINHLAMKSGQIPNTFEALISSVKKKRQVLQAPTSSHFKFFR